MNPAETLVLIAKHSAGDIAALAGGLTLIPENLHHLARLESLAMCAVVGRASGRRRVTRASARRILNDGLAEWVGPHDDPCETLATEAFTYNGGTHIFISPDAGALFTLRQLATIVANRNRLPESFVVEAIGLMQGICAVSHLIAMRARLVRNTPVPPAIDDVQVPPEARLKTLLRAVRFTPDEITALQTRTMLSAEHVDALSRAPADLRLPDPPHASDQLMRRPFLRVGDDLIVIAPHRLAEAAVHRLTSLGGRLDVAAPLARLFHGAVLREVDRSMERLGLRPCSEVLAARTDLADSIATHTFYQCDRDKVVHLALVSDALRLRDDVQTDTQWSSNEIEPEIVAAREFVPSLLARVERPIRDWMTLVIVSSFARHSNVLIDEPRTSEKCLLVLAAADLETIVQAEAADRSPLLLWKYARALRALKESGRVLSWSPLDTYAAWRGGDRTFPAVSGLVIAPGTGVTLRELAVAPSDWHAVPAPERDRTVEVVRADAPHQPIYMPRHGRHNRVRIVVECPNCFIWIVSTRETDGLKNSVRMLWFEIGRMIAFWLCEFAAALVEEFARLPEVRDVIVVEFEFVEAPDATASDVQAHYGFNHGSLGCIRVFVRKEFFEQYDDTNVAEREFALDLVQAVLSLNSHIDVAAAVEKCVDTVAPLGVKRMMHGINTARTPEFIGAAKLPRARYPNSADVAEVTKRVLVLCPHPAAPLTKLKARDWLNQAVKVLYVELRDRLAEFDGEDIRRSLLLNNEALVFEDARNGLTLASQLACFGSDKEFKSRYLEQSTRQAAGAVATRFLIEHVSAEPPAGSRELTDADFDECLAMASEIVHLGVASEVAHFELAEVVVEFEDGELAIKRGSYDEAARESLRAVAGEELVREQARVRVRGYKASAQQRPELFARLDEATAVEFGLSITELNTFIGEALALAQEGSIAVVSMPLTAFEERIRKGLGWSGPTFSTALSVLGLRSRDKYVCAPEGFHSGDIWPWRFNRALSYLRRPFVLVGFGAETTVSFTPGHVYRAAGNLVRLISSGRLKASSKQLSQIMAELTSESSDLFNEQVAETLRGRGFVVRTRVNKIGSKRIAEAGGINLGDVDVLCVDVRNRRMVAIECKDFRIARMPHEVRADLETLFVTNERKRCAQDKHLGRLRWLREHIREVRAWLAADLSRSEWKIDAAFVFSEHLISPLLGRALIPVWTLAQLRDGDGP